MELEDVNSIYNLIKENEFILRTYIYKWMNIQFNIDYNEMFNIILLAVTKYPCYINFCLKNKKLGNIKYLKKVITRYLGYQEGYLKGKSFDKKSLRDKHTFTLGDDIDWVIEHHSRSNRLDTYNIESYLFKRFISEYLRKRNNTTDSFRKAIYLYLTTNLTAKDIDIKIGKPIGYTWQQLQHFIKKLKKDIPNICEMF